MTASVRDKSKQAGPYTADDLLVKAAAIRHKELTKAFGQLRDLGEAERHTVIALATAITDGILHHPLQHLEAAGDSQYEQIVRDLFALDPTHSHS